VSDTIKVATKTMHPSTMSTIAKIKKGIENLQLGDGTKVVLVIE
jgi:hypothetical protein